MSIQQPSYAVQMQAQSLVIEVNEVTEVIQPLETDNIVCCYQEGRDHWQRNPLPLDDIISRYSSGYDIPSPLEREQN